MDKTNRIKVRVIRYDSDSYIKDGKYKEAVYESLKESGVFTRSKTSVNAEPLNYSKVRVIN